VRGSTFKRCPCRVVRNAAGRRVPCRKAHGSWWYAHEVSPSADGGRRQVREGGFATEREAADAMQQSMAGRRSHADPAAPPILVGAYLDDWLAGKSRLRASTQRSYAEHLRLYLKPALGFIRLIELRETEISRLYGAMRQLGQPVEGHRTDVLRRLDAARSTKKTPQALTDARIRRVHATLLSALNSAVKRRLLDHNPAIHVELPSGRRPRAVVWTDERVENWVRTGIRPAVGVWTAEQTGHFLDTASTDRLYPLFHLVAYRGLRRGEAVGLRWQDIDLDRRELHVNQQVVQLGWATEIGPPKTGSGTRTIPLDGGTCRVLVQWRDHQTRELRLIGATPPDTGMVFTRRDGTAVHPDMATDTFARLLDRAGLPPIRLHDLRHTAASLALQAGVPMKVVSEQLGHSSLAITADTYTSVLPAVARAAAEAVANVIPRTPRAALSRTPFTFRAQSGPKQASVPTVKMTSSQLSGGGPRGDRTHNPRIKSPLLYQLS